MSVIEVDLKVSGSISTTGMPSIVSGISTAVSAAPSCNPVIAISSFIILYLKILFKYPNPFLQIIFSHKKWSSLKSTTFTSHLHKLFDDVFHIIKYFFRCPFVPMRVVVCLIIAWMQIVPTNPMAVSIISAVAL